jgi:hypothetical protein
MKVTAIYLCPLCGHGSSENGECPECQVPLAEFGQEEQAEYQANSKIRNAIALNSNARWYL